MRTSHRTTLLIAGALTCLGLGALLPMPGDAPSKAAAPSMPDCVTEDQTFGPCYFDAAGRGNGHGTSFILDREGTITFLPVGSDPVTTSQLDVIAEAYDDEGQCVAAESEYPLYPGTDPATVCHLTFVTG